MFLGLGWPFADMSTLQSNVKKLYAFSFLKMSLFPMAIITLFWKDQIGLCLTEILLLQGIFSISMVVMEYPSGYLSDRIGYRAALTFASVMGIIGWGIYTVADSFAQVLIAEVILGFSISFISGSDSALLYESLKSNNEVIHYTRHEGRKSSIGQFGEACGALFAGILYDTAPLLPFIIQVLVWVLALILTRSMVEPQQKRQMPDSHLIEAWKSARYALKENKRLRYTILLTLALGLTSYYPIWLIQPYMQDCGVPLAWFGPIWAGANLSVALFALISHRSHLRLGDRSMILLFIVVVLAGYLGLRVEQQSLGVSFLLPADLYARVTWSHAA